MAMTNEMQNFMDDDADDDSPPSVPKLSFDDIVQGVNGGESLRFFKVDAQALADELRRLEGLKKNRSKQEERWYAFLKRTDSEAVPSPRKDVPMPAVRIPDRNVHKEAVHRSEDRLISIDAELPFRSAPAPRIILLSRRRHRIVPPDAHAAGCTGNGRSGGRARGLGEVRARWKR